MQKISARISQKPKKYKFKLIHGEFENPYEDLLEFSNSFITLP